MQEEREFRLMKDATMTRMNVVMSLWSFASAACLVRFGGLGAGSIVWGLCLLVGCIGLILLSSDIHTYLPFLGRAAFPPSVLKDKMTPAEAQVEVQVKADPGAIKVVFWASDSSGHNPMMRDILKPNPREAYGNYSNAGIAPVDGDGMAMLYLRCPSKYVVRGKKLPKHVHYRSVFRSGILGQVRTADVVCA